MLKDSITTDVQLMVQGECYKYSSSCCGRVVVQTPVYRIRIERENIDHVDGEEKSDAHF